MKRRTFLKGSLVVRHGGLWTVQTSAGRKAVVASLSLYPSFINLFRVPQRVAGNRRYARAVLSGAEQVSSDFR